MKIQYADLTNDPNAECKSTIETKWPAEGYCLDYIAEECAEHDVAHHDGMEKFGYGNACPFALFTEDGEPLGVFDVTMEMEPTYRAVLRELESDAP